MTTLRRAISNGSVLLVSQAITWVASLVLTATLGRQLGVAGFGNLYLAMSFVVVFGLFVEMGLDQQVVRAVARDPSVAASYLSAAVLIKTIAAVVTYPVMLAVVAALGYDAPFQHTLATYGLILLPIGLSASLGAVYQGSQRMAHPAIATVIEKVLVASAAIGVFAAGRGVTEVAAAMVAASTIAALWRARFISSVAGVAWRPTRAAIGALLRGAPPFLFYALLGTVYYRVDTVLLSKLTDATFVGWYGAAYRLFETMIFLPSIVSAALMYPILAQLSNESRTALRTAVTKGIQAISVVGIPIAVGLYVLADPVISLIYGRAGFAPAADALRWLMPGLLLLYLNSILTVALLSVNRERRLTVLAGLSCVFNIGLNLALIPSYQHVAAAAVTSGTEAFIFVFLLFNVPRDILERRAFVTIAKAASAALLMAAAILPLHSAPVPVIIAAGAAVYGIVGLALRVVTTDDLRALRAAVSRKPAIAGASEG